MAPVVLLAFLCLVGSAISAHIGQRTSSLQHALHGKDELLTKLRAFVKKNNVEKSQAMMKMDEYRHVTIIPHSANKKRRSKAKKTLEPLEPLPYCIVPPYDSPTCGTDGITYGNAYDACCSGATISHDGACTEAKARKSQSKQFNGSPMRGRRTSPIYCVCTEEYAAVCASLNGQRVVYGNQCEAECNGADVLYDLPLPFNPPDELPVEDLPTLTIQE